MNIPAFPAMHFDLADNEHGMTLRDYFAAKAMQAMLAHPNSKETAPPQTYASAVMQWQAYCMADAMLKAREA
jgi:hypothetical protein